MVRADCFSGLFAGFDRCGSLRLRSVRAAAFLNFRGPSPRRSGFGHAGGETSSSATAVGTKCAVPRSKLCFSTWVRTNSRILHHVGKVKEEKERAPSRFLVRKGLITN